MSIAAIEEEVRGEPRETSPPRGEEGGRGDATATENAADATAASTATPADSASSCSGPPALSAAAAAAGDITVALVGIVAGAAAAAR